MPPPTTRSLATFAAFWRGVQPSSPAAYVTGTFALVTVTCGCSTSTSSTVEADWQSLMALNSTSDFAIAMSQSRLPFSRWSWTLLVDPICRGPSLIATLPQPTTKPCVSYCPSTPAIAQFTDQLHPTLGPTTLWGYKPTVALGGGAQPQKHLGGIIVAQRDKPIQITFTNTLPSKHILPVDTSANFPDAKKRQNATATHLHGGFVPWISDGGPFAWFTPDGKYGPSVVTKGGTNLYQLLNPNLQPGQAQHYCPNDQSARLVWYHDHAHDLTRLNAYAGIASAYIIRDSFEANLRTLGLPDFVENGGREIPIVIQDRIFVGQNILAVDPTWTGVPDPGSLWYPHTYEPDRWELGDHPLGLPPDPSIVAEMFGDTMLANGTVYPEATVEARR